MTQMFWSVSTEIHNVGSSNSDESVSNQQYQSHCKKKENENSTDDA